MSDITNSAVRLRGRVFADESHADATAAMLRTMAPELRLSESELAARIDSDEEPIEFGYVFADGTFRDLGDLPHSTRLDSYITSRTREMAG